jgi:hypothetical protein
MKDTQFSHDDFQVRQFINNVLLTADIEKEGDFDFLTAPNGACYMASLEALEKHLLELQGLYNVIVKEGASASVEAVYMMIEHCDCYFDEGLLKFVNAINEASRYQADIKGINLGKYLLTLFGFTGVKKAVEYCNGLRNELSTIGLL